MPTYTSPIGAKPEAATVLEAKDLNLAFAIATTDPNEDGVNWLDSATATDLPEAQAKDMLWNRSGVNISLSGSECGGQ